MGKPLFEPLSGQFGGLKANRLTARQLSLSYYASKLRQKEQDLQRWFKAVSWFNPVIPVHPVKAMGDERLTETVA